MKHNHHNESSIIHTNGGEVVKIIGAVRRHPALLAAAILVVSLAGLAIWHTRSIDLARSVAFQTLELRHTIDRLEVSLGQSRPAGQVTKRYINHLKAIKKRCQTIKQDSTKAKKSGASSSLLSSFTATNSLCKDLVGLAGDSASTYQALIPLLGIDTRLKRYQTLPGARSLIRSNHQAKISSSLQTLGQSTLINNGFPSAAPRLLGELDKLMQSSTNLNYFPALSSAQAQLLAERQQFWTAYSGLSDLKRELNVQLERYCIQLKLSKSSVVCETETD